MNTSVVDLLKTEHELLFYQIEQTKLPTWFDSMIYNTKNVVDWSLVEFCPDSLIFSQFLQAIYWYAYKVAEICGEHF